MKVMKMMKKVKINMRKYHLKKLNFKDLIIRKNKSLKKLNLLN